MELKMRRAMEAIAALILYGAIHWLLRLPTSRIDLLWYDDAETLYHALSMGSGRVPYLEDATHHFLGYIAPFLGLGGIFGFNLSLTAKAALISQALSGAVIFLIIRMFFAAPLAFLGGLLFVSAREPFTAGFYVQHQINLLSALIIFFSLKFVVESKRGWLDLAALFSGAAFVCDQRALALSFIPAAAILVAGGGKKIFRLGSVLPAWSLIPAACLFYLHAHGAIYECFRQTIIFPARYRSAGLGAGELLALAAGVHKNLFLGAPILCFGGALGFWAAAGGGRSGRQSGALRLLGLAVLPFAVMPLFGGRSYDYYSYTWIPYLAVLSIFGAERVGKDSRFLWRLTLFTLCLAPILSLLAALKLWFAPELREDRDGARQTAAFLEKNIADADELLVWGYRLDMYIRLGRLAPTRFAGALSINPDGQVTSHERRIAGIVPEDQAEFLNFLESRPPRFVVVFNLDGPESSPDSPSRTALFQKLSRDYSLVFSQSGMTPAGRETRWRVYRSKA